MNLGAVEPLARTLLYEGFVLWPYRASALKNRRRVSLGGLAPRGAAAGDPSQLRCETLCVGTAQSEIELVVRFLHPIARQLFARGADGALHARAELCVDGVTHASWVEAAERSFCFGPFWLGELGARLELPIAVSGAELREALGSGAERRRTRLPLSACAALTAEVVAELPGGERAYRLRFEVANRSEASSDVDLSTLHACHVVARLAGGRFVSLATAPEQLQGVAGECRNERTWPILVGDPARSDTLLCSPIILSDFPALAPESPGDLFDATENDELLQLSILALPDAEREAMAHLDPRAAAILARATSLGASEQARLHGTFRDPRPAPLPPPAESLAPGRRVRLRPARRADVLDLALAGRTARVLSIERDREDRAYVTVAVDDDPGRALGVAGQIGHRFFFALDEVEPLEDAP